MLWCNIFFEKKKISFSGVWCDKNTSQLVNFWFMGCKRVNTWARAQNNLCFISQHNPSPSPAQAPRTTPACHNLHRTTATNDEPIPSAFVKKKKNFIDFGYILWNHILFWYCGLMGLNCCYGEFYVFIYFVFSVGPKHWNYFSW